jgi:hypothetical protein
MALRLNRLVMERDPSVATSLCLLDVIEYHKNFVNATYQIVATPCSGEVRTVLGNQILVGPGSKAP